LFSLAFSGCATTGTFPTSASAPSYAKTQHLYKGIDLLADKLIASMGQHTVGKLAVADFKGPEDITTALGEYISDKLSIRLYSSGAFQDFMERKELKQILTSRKVEYGGYFDQNTVKKFGKMIGVDSMVIGAIKDMGTFVDVTAKIVNSETGRLQGIADVSLKKDATVTELINRIRAATLTIAVDPAVSGTVIAGGGHAGLRNGTCTITGIPYGECQVIIHPDGHDTVRRGIPIRSQAETFAIRLEKRIYSVSFQVNPPDASLSVDGEKVSLNTEGFAKVTDLRAGEHSFRIQSKGYEARAGRFDPAGRQLIMLDLITNDPFYATKNRFFQKVKEVSKNQDFSVQLWTNQGSYKLGDSICFNFRAEENCYLNLVDITSDGKIRLIFPNRFHPDSYIRGGVTYRIPAEEDGFLFEVEPPTGTDRIYAIASTHPLNIFEHNFNQDVFTILTRGSTRGIKVMGIGVKLDQAKLGAASECVIKIRR
jgi:Curli production assembly/transport component CsgG.